MNNFAIRRFSSTDSIEEITRMLHRAFEPMARVGANCQCVDQTASTTRQRMQRGDCLVAVADRKIVGTLTLQACDPFSALPHYRQAGVASLHQFAVDPQYQGSGVGTSMLKVAAMWARMRQFSELALDTPVLALDVRAFYARQGFKPVQVVRLPERGYDSVLLSKAVGPEPHRRPGQLRSPAELTAAVHESPHGTARWLH